MYKLRVTIKNFDSEHDGYCSDPGNEVSFIKIEKIYIDYPSEEVKDENFDIVGTI